MAKLEEESDGTRGSVTDPDLDDLGLAIPEFRVPSKASGFRADPSEAHDDDEFEADNTEHIPTKDLESQLETDAGGAKADKAEAAPPSEELSEDDVPAGPADRFDRAELVKTVRMDAFDRKSVESGFSPMWDVVGFLGDQRFAPDVLVLPPRVLTKKWQEGARTRTNGAVPGGQAIPGNRSELATTVKTGQAATPQRPTSPAPEEAFSEGDFKEQPLSDESTEALDLDNDVIEEVKPPPKPREPAQRASSTPADSGRAPAASVEPARPEVERQRPSRTPRVTGPLPAQVPTPDVSEDDDLNGIVQELLDEKKPKAPKKQQNRPADKRTNWFQDVFSEEYFRTLPKDLDKQTEREIRFIYQALNLKKGARILDLACGFGRHAIELAQRDYEVAGLDASMAMLQRALSEAQRRNLNIKFIHGDMRELGFDQIFDACICWQTSFGYFDDRTNVSIAQGIARAIKPGGRLLLDLVNRDFVVAEMPSRTWWEGHECVFLEEVEFDNHTSILHTKRSFIYEDGSTPPREFSSYIRLYSLHELRQLLFYAGFRVIEVSGAIHHRGAFLGPTSPRIIVLAERIPPKDG